MAARGKMKDRNWRRSGGGPATIDDISVFVIPVLPYRQEVMAARREASGQGEEEGREAMEVQEGRVVLAGDSCDSPAEAVAVEENGAVEVEENGVEEEGGEEEE
jgi:hypothetical protein